MSHVSLPLFSRINRTYKALKAGETFTTPELIRISRSAAGVLKAAKGEGVTFDPAIKFPERVMYMVQATRHLAEQAIAERQLLAEVAQDRDTEAKADRFAELVRTEGLVALA